MKRLIILAAVFAVSTATLAQNGKSGSPARAPRSTKQLKPARVKRKASPKTPAKAETGAPAANETAEKAER